jgi:uncharacterized protein
MFPSLPHAKSLALEDRAAFMSHMARHPRDICELSFASLFIWQDFDRVGLSEFEGNLCVRIEPLNEPPFYLEPVGEGPAMDAAEACLGETGRISRATTGFVAKVRGNGFQIAELRNHHDYIYRVADLAELKGRRYDGKRNHIKGMRRSFPNYVFRPLAKADAPAARELFERWCRGKPEIRSGREDPRDLAYECQRWALDRAFSAFDELGLFGGALTIDGTLAGFVLASELSPAMACVHLEYHLPAMSGLAQTLIWESCRTTFAPFVSVNLEQDLGIEGLRRAKASYYPARMEEKFEVVSPSYKPLAISERIG